MKCPSKVKDWSEFGRGKEKHTGDQQYYFTSYLFGKPVVIHSRRQYKRLLKEHNLADASPKECNQEAQFRQRIMQETHNQQRKEFAKKIGEKMHKEGVAGDFPSYLKKFYVKKG